MEEIFRFRGRIKASIVENVLNIPREVRPFYELDRGYYIMHEFVDDEYPFAAIFPDRELKKLISELGYVRMPRTFLLLNKVDGKNDLSGLVLSDSTLQHLALKRNDEVTIVGNGIHPYFEIWKPDYLDAHSTPENLLRTLEALAQMGI